MPARIARRDRKGEAASTLIRIVIASYFIALALGIVPGMDMGALTGLVLPEPHASWAGSATVFTLAFLLLTGTAVRTTTLLLALALFWTSYITMVHAGPEEALAGFWRDLALVGALLLAYRDAQSGRSLFRQLPKARPIRIRGEVRPRRVTSEPAPGARVTPLIPVDRETAPASEPRKRRAAG